MLLIFKMSSLTTVELISQGKKEMIWTKIAFLIKNELRDYLEKLENYQKNHVYYKILMKNSLAYQMIKKMKNQLRLIKN